MRSPAELARPLLVAACTVLAAGVVAAAAPRDASASVAVAAASTDVRFGAPAGAAAVLTEIPAAVSSTTTTPAPPTTALPITAAPTTTTVPPVPAPTAPAPAPAPAPVATVAAPQAAPAPTPAPPPTTAAPRPAASDPPGVDTACERELFDRTNAARRSAGLAPLAFDSGAHSVSRAWSFRMADAGRLAHNPRYGEDLTAAGVDWQVAGENVGRGSVDAVFQLWMDSPAHRANVLSPDYRAFAVGCVPGGGQYWVTQNYWG